MSEVYTKEQAVKNIANMIVMFIDAMHDCGIPEEKAEEILDLVDQRLIDIKFGKITGD